MAMPRLFQGLRLSTREQQEMVARMLKEPETQMIQRGDTVVFPFGSTMVVARIDWEHQLTAKQFKERDR